MYTTRQTRGIPRLAAAVFLASVSLAAAQPRVIGEPRIDATTGGDWTNGPEGNYGSCFFLFPRETPPLKDRPESFVGPDFYKGPPSHAGQYEYTRQFVDPEGGFPGVGVVDQCKGGPLLPVVDWRVFSQFPGGVVNNVNVPANVAFVYSLCEPGDEANGNCRVNDGSYSVAPGASQFNPAVCRTNTFPRPFQNGTWDNERSPEYDPLTVELEVNKGGDARLAFYFLDAPSVCRTVRYTLSISYAGNPNLVLATGTIGNFADGKYLVFDVADLPPGGSIVRLQGQQAAPSESQCATTGLTAGVNVHISGAFISGDICKPDIDIRKQKEGDDSRTFYVASKTEDDDDDHGDDDHDWSRCKESSHFGRDGRHYSKYELWAFLSKFFKYCWHDSKECHDDRDCDGDGRDCDHNGGTSLSVPFQIVVTNTGAQELTNVVVEDAKAPQCDKTIGTLAAGASVTYTCTDTHVKASYTNLACVTGTVSGDVTESDCDPSTVIVKVKRCNHDDRECHDGKDCDDDGDDCDHDGKGCGHDHKECHDRKDCDGDGKDCDHRGKSCGHDHKECHDRKDCDGDGRDCDHSGKSCGHTSRKCHDRKDEDRNGKDCDYNGRR